MVDQALDGEVRVDVRLERETVWLSLNQMAELFARDKSVISRHLGRVFSSGERDHQATGAKNATVAAPAERARRHLSAVFRDQELVEEATAKDSFAVRLHGHRRVSLGLLLRRADPVHARGTDG